MLKERKVMLFIKTKGFDKFPSDYLQQNCRFLQYQIPQASHWAQSCNPGKVPKH